MKSFQISGTLRPAVGKKAARKLRVEQAVPCVLYGGKENVHFSTLASNFRHLIYTPLVQLVELEVNGTTYKAILQDVQYHPVTDAIVHADFVQIFEDKKVIIGIPVVTVGLATGVKEGGKLAIGQRKLKVRAFYKDLPDTIEVNVEKLAIGQSVKVGELSVDKLEFLDAKNVIVATVKSTRAAKAAADAATGKK